MYNSKMQVHGNLCYKKLQWDINDSRIKYAKSATQAFSDVLQNVAVYEYILIRFS